MYKVYAVLDLLRNQFQVRGFVVSERKRESARACVGLHVCRNARVSKCACECSLHVLFSHVCCSALFLFRPTFAPAPSLCPNAPLSLALSLAPTFYPTTLPPPMSSALPPPTVLHAHIGIQRCVKRAPARSGSSSTAVPMPRPCACRAPSRSREAAHMPPADAQSGLIAISIGLFCHINRALLPYQ